MYMNNLSSDFAIITPTYAEHFCFIKNYLKAIKKYVISPKDISFVFIIEKDDYSLFKSLINPFAECLKIEILCIEELLNEKVVFTPKQILDNYGKYAYQTLKKYYAMLDLPYEKYLVLDSESMCIRPTDLQKLFTDFFENPFISGSEINEKMLGEIKRNVCMCTDYLLDFKSDKWFLENFNWFYDKSILTDLFNELGSPFDIVCRAHEAGNKGLFKPYVFEICLYQNYIYKNNNKYHYRILNTTDLCKEYLGDRKFEDYLKRYYARFGGEGGLLEFVYNLLSKENVEDLADMIKENCFHIIRCENTSCSPLLQRRFMKLTQPYILAASQSHAWGINRRFLRIIRYQYYPWLKSFFIKLLKKVHLYSVIKRIIYRR